jgi:hypothetical protein
MMNCTHGTPTTTHCPPCADLVAQFTAHMDHLDDVYGRDTRHLADPIACLPDCPECGDRGYVTFMLADAENGPEFDQESTEPCTCAAGDKWYRDQNQEDDEWAEYLNGHIAKYGPNDGDDRDDFPMELEYDDQYESGAYESI